MNHQHILTSAEINQLRRMKQNVSLLPPYVKGILDCSRFQIQKLQLQVLIDAADESEAGPDHQKQDIEDALDDGFMCIDLHVVETKLRKWQQLFPQVIPYFAMKCNPDPMIVQWLSKFPDVGFDVASWTEFQLAMSCIEGKSLTGRNENQLPRLIYANPQRAEQDLAQCMTLYSCHGGTSTVDQSSSLLWLTVDGLEELHKIFKISKRQNFPLDRIGLIVRILVPDHHSTVPLGEKFGISLEEIEVLVQEGLKLSFQPNNFIGVSFHCGSGCHDPETYLLALQLTHQALDLIHSTIAAATEHSHKCWLIDIGGGFPGWDGVGGDSGRFSSQSNNQGVACDAESPESTRAIAEAMQPSLQEFFKDGYQIISEPGRFFVEAAVCLASRIYHKRIVNKLEYCTPIREYKIAHGVQGVFKDVLLCGEYFRPLPLVPGNNQDMVLFDSQVRGPSSGEQDVVCAQCSLPELEVGDWLVFDRMGAYALSIASRTGRPVMCYVQGGGNEVL
jgi:ornithine decarboxylase